MEEIRKANRGCSATELVFYFSENFPVNFTQGELLITECPADYYRTGELTATEYAGKNYNSVDHHIKDFTVTKDDLKILLGEQLFLLDKLRRITEWWRMCRSAFPI